MLRISTNSQSEAESLANYLGFGGSGEVAKDIIDISEYKPSQEIIDFITSIEGKVPYVYDDADKSYPKKKYCNSKGSIKGTLTIGIGYALTSPNAKMPGSNKSYLDYYCDKSPLSEFEMKDMFVNDKLKTLGVTPLKNFWIGKNASYSQCQYDALLSLVFNRGSMGAGNDDWENKIKKGKGLALDYSKTQNAFVSAFNHKKGVDEGWYKGVLCRRLEEANIFKNCDYGLIGKSDCDANCCADAECIKISTNKNLCK